MVNENNNNSKSSRAAKKLSRPARNVNLVVTAMRNLAKENGSTVANIMEYINAFVGKPASKREVLAALKRGVEFGLMDRKRGRYFFTPDEKQRLRPSPGNMKLRRRRSQESKTSSDEVLERGPRSLRSRNPERKEENRENKSKDSPRRRRRVSRKSTGRRSVKKTRFARSLKSYELSDSYKNPHNKPSAVSSIDSLEYYEAEGRKYWN